MHLRQPQGCFDFRDKGSDGLFALLGIGWNYSNLGWHRQAALPKVLESHRGKRRFRVCPTYEPVQIGFKRQEMLEPFLQRSQLNIQLGGFEAPDEIVEIELSEEPFTDGGGEGRRRRQSRIVGWLRLLLQGLQVEPFETTLDEVDASYQVRHVVAEYIIRDSRGESGHAAHHLVIESGEEALLKLIAVVSFQSCLDVPALVEAKPRDQPVSVFRLDLQDRLAKAIEGGHVRHDFAAEFSPFGDLVGHQTEHPQVLHKGKAQQPTYGQPQGDPGGQAKISGNAVPFQRTPSGGEEGPVFGEDLGKDIVEEESLAGTGQDLPFLDESQGLQEVAVGTSFLAPAAEKEASQDGGFLVGILLESSFHKGFQAALQFFEFFGKEQQGGIDLLGFRFLEDQQPQIAQPLADSFEGFP